MTEATDGGVCADNTMACVTNSLCMGTDAMKVPCDAGGDTKSDFI